MTTDTMIPGQELIAVTGKLVAATKEELASALTSSGHRLVSPKSTEFSVLVTGCQPDGADVAKAKTIGAIILTERQFLERFSALELIARLEGEASEPTTSKKRLTELAAVVPEAVARNPLWQILHLENPNFLANENKLMKLRLLQLVPADMLEDLVDSLMDSVISVDVFEIAGATFEGGDANELSHLIRVDDFDVTLYCYDCDANMEDVGIGCEERLSIGASIKAFLLSPFEDIRQIAEQYGIEYEGTMSPRDGYPLRFGGISIESEDEYLEYESDSFPGDSGLIAKLNNTEDGYYVGVSLDEVGERRPLFSSSPVADEDSSCEGFVTLRWVCDCFVTVEELGDGVTKWRKIEIDEEVGFKGSNMHEDYTVHYEIDFPCELEARIASDLQKNSAASGSVDACLRNILGLLSSGMTN